MSCRAVQARTPSSVPMKRFLDVVTGFGLVALAGAASAQQPAQPVHHGRGATSLAVAPPRIDADAAIDGMLTEPAWRQAALLTGFSQFEPLDGVAAEDSTEVLVWYSATAIHFGIRAYERHGAVNATLADRDRIGAEDHVQLLLGTFNDGRQATVIGVNPLGVQMDGTLLESNQRGRTGAFGTESARESTDLSPDFVFESKGRVTEWGYEVEVRVPFKSLRYQTSLTQTWGFNVVRRVQHLGAEDSWAPARRASASFLQQGGTLAGLTDLRRGMVLDLNPSVTQRTLGSARPAPGDGWRYSAGHADVGGNVRWGITSNVTFNATVNPDFSQVESDAGQFSFDPRQAVFLPEKRPFFLEGSELFATPGNLVYSRRVVQPEFAAKLTGRMRGVSLAVLGAVDDRDGANSVNPAEAVRDEAQARPLFAIARASRELGRRGRIGITYTDREREALFNRVASVDGRVVFGGIYTGVLHAAGSATRRPVGTRDTTTTGTLASGAISRSGERFGFTYSFRALHPEFRTQAGFIGRPNLVNAVATHRFTRRGAKGSLVENLSFDPQLVWVWKHSDFVHQGDAIEKKSSWNVNAVLRGGWAVNAGLLLETFGYDADLYRGYRILRGPGDTIPFTGVPRLFNRDYTINISTPAFRRVNGSMFILWGRDENFEEWASGDILWFNTELQLRPSDRARVDLNYSATTVHRPTDGSEVLLSSIPRAKLEYQLSRAVFVRLVGEYNTYRRDALRDDSRTGAPILIDDRPTFAFEENRFRGDALFSYQPTPGTVVFAGYGSTHDGYGSADPEEPLTRPRRLVRTEDAFFVKVSYLFRM